MGHDTDTSVEPESYYDPAVGMVVTKAGKARWRERLAEADSSRDLEGRAALLAKLRQGPAAVA